DLADRVQRRREDRRDPGDAHRGSNRRLRGPGFPAAVQEREDEERDDGDTAQQVAPERRVEDRLQRGAFTQRELGEDVRDFEKAQSEQTDEDGNDQYRRLRASGDA